MPNFVFGPVDVEVRTGGVPRLVRSGIPVYVYRDQFGQLPAAVVDLNGNPVALRVNGHSQVPAFALDQDDLPAVWLRVQNGPLTKVEANEVSDVALGYVETKEFTRQGVCQPMVGTIRLPIHGGTFRVESVAAMVGTAPVGASMVIDIKKNGTSIYGDPANRPTISDNQNVALVGAHSTEFVGTGDFLTVDIVGVGTTVPGSDLVVSIRVRKQ